MKFETPLDIVCVIVMSLTGEMFEHFRNWCWTYIARQIYLRPAPGRNVNYTVSYLANTTVTEWYKLHIPFC